MKYTCERFQIFAHGFTYTFHTTKYGKGAESRRNCDETKRKTTSMGQWGGRFSCPMTDRRIFRIVHKLSLTLPWLLARISAEQLVAGGSFRHPAARGGRPPCGSGGARSRGIVTPKSASAEASQWQSQQQCRKRGEKGRNISIMTTNCNKLLWVFDKYKILCQK